MLMAETPKVTRTFTVRNKLGLHARPASLMAKTASRFLSEITICKDGSHIDAKSIMGVLMLAAGHGSELEVSARGEDAVEALDALEQLVTSNFGED